MIALLCIWVFLVLPLTFVGSLAGRRRGMSKQARQQQFPTRTNPIPRPIPDKPWYLESYFIVLAGGLLPFGSILIELYFVFSSFWAYKIYYVYGFLLLILLILWVVVACVCIVGTYFQLNSEDWRWHWVSYGIGGSIALYVYLYSIYYFFAKTRMYGLFQSCYYFGYMMVGCFMLFMICGSVGHLAASHFVHRIYSSVKID